MAKPPAAAILPFRPAARAALPVAQLPLPGGSPDAPGETRATTAIDLSGKPKAIFLIGRGRIGKTTVARVVSETMVERGGSAIVAAADPVNRSLRNFVNDVAEPPSTDAEDGKDWLRSLLGHCMAERASALIDLGGGSTILSALLREMPDLADALTAGGVAPVALHVIGPDPHDLVPLAITEGEGFKPAATALVLNEAHGRRHKFDQVRQHPAYRAAIDRGAVEIWLPYLNADAARLIDANGWHYSEVKTRGGPFTASAVHMWLRRLREELAPISTWIPGA